MLNNEEIGFFAFFRSCYRNNKVQLLLWLPFLDHIFGARMAQGWYKSVTGKWVDLPKRYPW